jgi:hypothetical protein
LPQLAASIAPASSNFMEDWADAREGANIVITQRKSRIRVMPAPNTRRAAVVKRSV